jgi:uncharacterized membrane protein
MRLPTALIRAQDRLATLLGCEPGGRSAVVQEMLTRSPRESTGYWLQLVVAAGIATLGLALDSTAVVIAAMLVAPLMRPIVALGMGLATGSPFLVLRGSVRVGNSVAVVVALSAGITWLLPFHEINSEIAAPSRGRSRARCRMFSPRAAARGYASSCRWRSWRCCMHH